MTPDEVREILAELAVRFDEDLNTLWSSAASLPSEEFRALIAEAYPELVLPYSAMASEVGAQWYESTPSDIAGYAVRQGDLPTTERLTSSALWALKIGIGDAALPLLGGSGERAIFDGLRDTIDLNVESEPGALWARHASANACPFCRMLCTRGAVYLSEKTAAFKAHDSCHCIPAPTRPGDSYVPPPYVAQWEKQYVQARRDAGSGDPKAILNAWDRALRV